MDVPGIITCQNNALTTPLLFDPGERWDYGINIDFAGKMVEAASGQKLGKYLQDNLFGPLGMDSTAFKITPTTCAQRLARIHQRGADGELTPDRPRDAAGAGVRDGRRRALLHGRRLPEVRAHDAERGQAATATQILKPETVAEMSKNTMGDIKVTLLKTAAPPFTNDAEFFPGMPQAVGPVAS